MTCFLTGTNWFFGAYLGLYMFAPILNAFIDKADEKQMMWMTLAFFAFQTVFGWMLKNGEFYYGLTSTSLIGWYLIGGWLRKSTLRCFHLKPWQNMAVFIGVGQISVVVALVAAYCGIEKGTYSYISPLQVIQTTYLFLFCRSLKISTGREGNHILCQFCFRRFVGSFVGGCSTLWFGYEMGYQTICWHLLFLP